MNRSAAWHWRMRRTPGTVAYLREDEKGSQLRQVALAKQLYCRYKHTHRQTKRLSEYYEG